MAPINETRTSNFTFNIDLYADTLCPWCYIGKKALDKAIAIYTAHHPDVAFNLTWKPYMLYPNAAVSAYDKSTTLALLSLPPNPSPLSRLTALGRAYAISFAWTGKTGNSRSSHKLILLAASQDAAAASRDSSTTAPHPNGGSNINTNANTNTTTNRLVDALFSQTSQHGADPSSHAFLARLAVETGVFPTEEAAMAFLEGEDIDDEEEEEEDGDDNNRNGSNISIRLGQAVDQSSAEARRVGVTGVPSYVVQGRWLVGGMQKEGVWLEVFEGIRGKDTGVGENGDGKGRGMRVEEGNGGGVGGEGVEGWRGGQ